MSGDPVHQKGQERLLHFFKTLCAAESSDALRVLYFKQAEFPKLSTPRLMPGYTAESLRPPEIISL
jgi:hypothetical protein